MKQRFFHSTVLATIILLSIASSCRKDFVDPANPSTPPQEAANLPIKQIKWTESEHQTFSYNAQNQVAQFRNQWQYAEGDPVQLRTIIYDFQYDTQNRPVQVHASGGCLTNYFYRNNLVEKTQELSPTGTVLEEINYFYAGNRIVQEFHTQRDLSGQPAGNYKYTFFYDARGNLNKIKSYTLGENQEYELFETTEFSDFDDKVNPASWTLRAPYLPQMRWQLNNPGKVVTTPVNGTPRIVRYEYSYNALGLPVSKQKTSPGSSVSGIYEY